MNDTDALPPLTADTAELYVALAVDGSLQPADLERLSSLMADSPELVTLFQKVQTSEAKLAGALSGVTAAPLPLTLAHAASQKSAPKQQSHNLLRKFSWTAVAAGFALAIISVGPAAYHFGRDDGQRQAALDAAGWINQVADYHRLYGNERRHLVAVRADEIDHIRSWLSKRIGTSVMVPDLRDHGLEFAGARLLVAAGRPVAQLMYTQPDGLPVGFCLTESTETERVLFTGTRADLSFASWTEDGVARIIIGWEDPARLKGLEKAIRRGISL